MNNNRLSIYFDLSLWIRTRINTGIQRVLKEFIQRTLNNENPNMDFYYLVFDVDTQSMHQIKNSELREFLFNIKDYQFKQTKEFNGLSQPQSGIAIFFDMDAAWNSLLKRHHLYPQLKQNNYYIFNFLYDLSPVLLPQFCDENTCRNFVTYLSAVYSYSDMVFLDSASAEKGLLTIKNQIGVKRNIPTRVIGLGADYMQQAENNLANFDQQHLLKKKYLLFVGTLEPRKSQKNVLDAFPILAKKYPDLNLILIGKQGWKVNNLIRQIESHPLKDKQIHWLNNIDDDTLSLFYKNAWMVIYLSKHEGYGLPIAESLRYNNLTIASKNSSMYEVGRDFADYVVYNSQNEIIDIISLYYDNPELYKLKKQTIQNHYQFIGWETVCQSLFDILAHFPTTLIKTKQHQTQLQFVFISIDIETLQGTISAIDKYINFVKEYIVVTNSQHIEVAQKLVTKRKITLIEETQILGPYAKDFNQRNHQKKNWLLRASLLNIEHLENEFVMLDDDNRPLKDLDLSYFIDADGRYKAYFFYDILNWNHNCSAYDEGQHNLKTILSKHSYELLSYSSHAPQIINKDIFAQAVKQFFNIGLEHAIDEWSIYFNYAVSHYPYLFQKSVFETLNWPAIPADWQYQYIPEQYSFENYYPSLYATDESKQDNDTPFLKSFNLVQKIAIKQQQYAPFIASKAIFDQYQYYLAYKNKIHGCLRFEAPELSCYLFSLPKQLICISESMFRLAMNVKIINHSEKAHALQLYYLINGHMGHYVEWQINTNPYHERIIELPISTYGMRRRNSQLQIDLKINQRAVYGKNSTFKIKLTQYKNPDQVNLPNMQNKLDQIEKEPFNIKQFIIQNIQPVYPIGQLFRHGFCKIQGLIKK